MVDIFLLACRFVCLPFILNKDEYFQVNMETIFDTLKTNAVTAKNIILEAIPRIAAVNWDPIHEEYQVNF